jgi:YVTN family beta-propeller protein
LPLVHADLLGHHEPDAQRLSLTCGRCGKLRGMPSRRSFALLVLALWSARAQAQPALRLLVTNEDSGDVSVIDLGSEQVVATVSVGKRPRGIRLTPDGRLALVALSGSPKGGPGSDEMTAPPPDRTADGIGILDLATLHLSKVLKSGQDPESFDVSRDGKVIYVSNEETAETSVVDLRSGKVVSRIKVGGEPEGVTLRPDGKVVYVTSEVDNKVFAIDVAKRKVLNAIEVGARPRSVVFTPDGKTAFVTCELGAQVAVLDGQTHKARGHIAVEAPGARPMGGVLSPDAKLLYVSNGRGSSVTIIDVGTEKVTGTIAKVGVRPWGIAVSTDGRRLYTANGPSNDVSVIDLATKAVIKQIKVGRSPWGLALQHPSK